MKNITFKDLNISDSFINELTKNKITQPTLVQIKAIPEILNRKNVIVKAPTGSGKTIAFLLPTLELIKNKHEPLPRVLILSPTRELSNQIEAYLCWLDKGTNLDSCLVIGGVKEKHQINKLKKGVDIVVATPGRLRDLIEQKKFDYSNIKHFILDEVDMMLDMGFYKDINFIYKKMPPTTQILFFSATIPNKIRTLINQLMSQYEFIDTESEVKSPSGIKQKLYYVNNQEKLQLLMYLLIQNLNKSIMIFANKKTNANFITYFLNEVGIRAKSIHGDKPQYLRSKIISDFKKGICNVLIGTDLAARGIHVDNVGLVINFDVPTNPDTYIHRMGRTGRANQKGECITFCSFMEIDNINTILKEMGDQIEILKFNAGEMRLPNNVTKEILNSHPSYAIQARSKNVINVKKHNKKNNFYTKNSYTKFISERATVSARNKSKSRVAEEKLKKKDNDWETNL